MEVDVPVLVVAIAALPAVALLLAFVAQLESRLFGSALDDATLRERYLGSVTDDADARQPQLADNGVVLG